MSNAAARPVIGIVGWPALSARTLLAGSGPAEGTLPPGIPLAINKV